jgi:hypothetical protein
MAMPMHMGSASPSLSLAALILSGVFLLDGTVTVVAVVFVPRLLLVSGTDVANPLGVSYGDINSSDRPNRVAQSITLARLASVPHITMDVGMILMLLRVCEACTLA